MIADASYTATFSKPATAPTAFNPQSTTLLSPHHHFGSLSVRLFYWRVMDVLKRYPKGKQSTIPTNLIGQLLFRDMYFAAQAPLGYSFAQTVGNSHCKFIPWHLPSKIDPHTHLMTGEYEIDRPQAETWFQRWKWGQTGFPWIDAVMRQLRQEGWIHHLARHAVACFLTRGGCYIHWERGAEVFEEWLIDHEVACNTGNWQWLACTAFYSQFYRCYSPVAFPKKTDPEGDFVRHFVPELKNFPKRFVYEPWSAPIAVQKQARCLVVKWGDDNDDDELGGKQEEAREEEGEAGTMKTYPKPMFDFPERKNACIAAMKNAYAKHLYGDHPKVLDGSWRELLSDDEAEGEGEGEDEGEEHDDGQEAAELGGETRGGDRVGRNPVVDKKRKRQGRGQGRGQGQGTLDGVVKKGKKKVELES